MDNVKINTDNTIAREPEESLKCKICNEEIKREPITTERMMGFGDSKGEYHEETFISIFCSKECEYIDDVLDPMHRMMGDLTRIINHLIKDHGYKVEILEKVLNSKKFKDLWDGEVY